MSGATIRAALHAVEVPSSTLAGVRRTLAASAEGQRLLERLTRRFGGRSRPAAAALDRMVDRMLTRVLADFSEATAQSAERLERHLGRLLDDIENRRLGLDTRATTERLADLEQLATAARDMRSMEQHVRDALAAPESDALRGARHDVSAELRAALDELDVDAFVDAAFDEGIVRPDARTTRTGSVRVQDREDVRRAFAGERTSTTEPAAEPRERTVRDSQSERRARERAGRTALQVSPTDPRLARVDLGDLPVRRDDFVRFREGGRVPPSRAAGRARRLALDRVFLAVGHTIDQLGPLRRHWDDVVGDLLAGRSVDDVGQAGMIALYERAQGRFWERVAGDAGATDWLRQRGLVFEAGSRAPVVHTNGNRALPVEEVRISLDHLAEKAVGDNWRRALDPSNLALVPSAPNSAREALQAIRGMRP